MVNMRGWVCGFVLLSGMVWAGMAQSTTPSAPGAASASKNSSSGIPAPPRSDASAGESSSNDTKVDLSPPPGEPGLDLRPGTATSDVQEFHPWDPHKADKCVEVGDFYYKRKNYAAATSRYREALYWKADHAIALFRLAQALEQTEQYDEARKNYQQYLKILPNGEYAAQSRKALEKLAGKTATKTERTTKTDTDR